MKQSQPSGVTGLCCARQVVQPNALPGTVQSHPLATLRLSGRQVSCMLPAVARSAWHLLSAGARTGGRAAEDIVHTTGVADGAGLGPEPGSAQQTGRRNLVEGPAQSCTLLQQSVNTVIC